MSTKGESCNYGVTDLLFARLPAGEDYCQNVYLPYYIRGNEIELSYKFTCNYSGSSPQGIVSTYTDNGCSGIPSNETILKNGDFYCCQDCDDECDWLYFNLSLYNDSNCAILDYSAYDFAFLDWVNGNCVNLNDSTMYMQLNDTLFTNKESDDENDCENGEWYYKFYSIINKCQLEVGENGNGTTFYYYASVGDEFKDNGFSTTEIERIITTANATMEDNSIDDSNPADSGDTDASNPRFNSKNYKMLTCVCFVLSYFVW